MQQDRLWCLITDRQMDCTCLDYISGHSQSPEVSGYSKDQMGETAA